LGILVVFAMFAHGDLYSSGMRSIFRLNKFEKAIFTAATTTATCI